MSKRPDTFELRRHVDGLVYVFERRRNGGMVAYKRTDGDYWVIRHPRFGWIAGNHESDEVFGRPWDVLPSEQGDAPPEGLWVSRKGSKSYVYDLVHTSAD